MEKIGKILVLSVIAALVPWSSYANIDSEPAFFAYGGNCPSQGLWTNNALEQASKIRNAIRSLADQPACKGVSEKLNLFLGGMQENISNANQSEELHGHVRRSQAEVSSALRFLFGGGGAMGTASQAQRFSPAMMTHINWAMASSGAQYLGGTLGAIGAGGPQTAITTRLQKSVGAGLDLFSELQNEILNSYESCFMQDSMQAGQVLSASVYMLSAFLTSGHNVTGAKLANAISMMTNFFQQLKNKGAISASNELSFNQAMRCLLESTYESYCAVLDSKALQDSMARTMGIANPAAPEMSEEFERSLNKKRGEPNNREADVMASVDRKRPEVAGIYVLTQYMPVIMSYIQKLLLGVRPNTPQEADFQTTILQDINDFQIQVKRMQGILAQESNTIRQMTSDEAKANQIVSLVNQISAMVLSDREGKNFFLFSMQANAIPFFFVGIDPEGLVAQVPEVFRPQAVGLTVPMTPTVYFQTYGPTKQGVLSILKQPDPVLRTINDRVNQLIDMASIRANEYYGMWFLADQAGLVDDTFIRTNMRFSFQESLLAISNYIADLEARLARINRKDAILPTMADTRDRIRMINEALTVYKNLKNGVIVSENNVLTEKRRKSKEAKDSMLQILVEQVTRYKNDLTLLSTNAEVRKVYFERAAEAAQLAVAKVTDSSCRNSLIKELREAGQLLGVTINFTTSDAGGGTAARSSRDECATPPQLARFIELSTLSKQENLLVTRLAEIIRELIAQDELEIGILNRKEIESEVSPLQARAVDVMGIIYHNLNILLSRSMFLANRMEQYVLVDYNTMIEEGIDFTPYQQQLMIVLGSNLLPELKNLMNENWQTRASDLLNAAHINSENANRLEEIFRNPMIKWIRQLKVARDNPKASSWALWLESITNNLQSNSKSYKDFNELPTESSVFSMLKDIAGSHVNLLRSFWNTFAHADRYHWPDPGSELTRVRTVDSAVGAIDYLLAQSCILALGFEYQEELPFLCKDVVLKPSFDYVGLKEDQHSVGGLTNKSRLQVVYNERIRKLRDLRVNYAKNPSKELRQQLSLDRDQRICALRSYYRDNFIYQTAVGMKLNREKALQATTQDE